MAGTAGAILDGCMSRAQSASAVRLKSRPGKPAKAMEAGTHPLGIRNERDALLYVPNSVGANAAAPLVVYLHGATGGEQQGIRRLGSFADDNGFLLLSPASEGFTWDAIREGYGRDVTAIDEALNRTFEAHAVDPGRIALAGFSDGASYALGLGLSNGDLFRSVLAFSPGFIPEGAKFSGKPRVFVSHGTADRILPIDSCSRRLVPELKRAGLNVTYREFDGPHAVPREILEHAMHWLSE